MNKKDQIKIGVIILAAGRGRRMCSEQAKVLTRIGGHSMIVHVLRSVSGATPKASVAVVVGHQKEEVIEEVQKFQKKWYPELQIDFCEQAQMLGTGDAVRSAIESTWGENKVSHYLVLPGDQPLMTHTLIEQMLSPIASTVAMRMMTCVIPEPLGYGRVVRRGKKGQVLRIVEEKDANPREKLIQEVATSVFLYRGAFLKAGLKKLSNKNAQKEFYLTDLVVQASRTQKKIDVVQWEHSQDLMGVNNPWEWSRAAKILNRRCLKRLAISGVHFQDPDSTWVDEQVSIAEFVTIEKGASLKGDTVIQRGARIGENVIIKNSEIGNQSEIKAGSVIEDSKVGEECKVGPYAHFRPNSVVGDRSKIGNFVELKKSQIGSDTSIAHLSYLGDAEVGHRVNIGCGFVTCNFDGRVINGSRKHKTIIGDDVFLGSDCQVIAPIEIEKESYIASGSTVTHKVESGDLAIARSRQVNKKGLAKRFLKMSQSKRPSEASEPTVGVE